MKKSLSLLVAIAMVFSMFASMAFAADELTAEQKYEALVEAGIFEGFPDGEAHLDDAMTRAQAAKIIALLTGYTEETEVEDAGFTDLAGAGWAEGYINYVAGLGIVNGMGDNKFAPSEEVTIEQLAKMVVETLEIEVDEEATVDGEVSDWAVAYVAAAVEAGLLEAQEDYTVSATRGLLVVATYTAYGELVEADVAAEQTGVKQVTVEFNKAVDDTKAKFVVKNGVATRDVIKTTFSEDKTSVVLDLSSKLLNGASTVTVTGVSETELVASFTAAEEKITEIQFLSDKAALGTITSGTDAGQPDYDKISVGYKIVNQFNEDVTKTAGGSLTFQVGKAGATGTGTNGVLTINSTTPFMFNETVYVSAILNLSTYGVTATKTLTVGQQAMVDTVEIVGLYHPEGKELMTNSTFSDFYILVDAKDQYGNKVTLDQFKAGVFAVASNGTLFTINKDNAQSGVGENNDQIGIPLTAPTTGIIVFDGTNQVRVQTLFGQKTDTLDVVVKKASTLATFTLSQPDVVSVNATVKIPFTAMDQNGVELTKFSDLDGKVNLYASNGTGAIELKQDYATKKAYIEWTAPSVKGLNFLSATVIGTNSNSQLQINVVDAGVADAVVGVKDLSKSLYVNSKVKIEPKHIVIKDQFGRDMNSSVVASTYDIKISAADGTPNVVTGFTTAALTSGGVELTAAAKGTERVKIELFKKGTTELISTYEGHTFTVVDNSAIESYEVATIEKISKKTGHAVEVKVTGKRSDGTTVTLPTDAYTVIPSANLTYDKPSNKLNAESAVVEAGKTVTATYTVTILATTTLIAKEVTISDEALKPTTLEQKDAGTLKAKDLVVKGPAADIDLASVLATVKVKDQFGVEMTGLTGADFYASVSALDDVNKSTGADLLEVDNNGGLVTGTDAASVTGVEQGDSFTVIFYAKANSAANITVKVVAE